MSLKWSRSPSQSTRELSKAERWKGASPVEFDGESMENETETWSEFRNGEKTTEEQIGSN